jgi:GTPase SAR1 family protein
MEMALRSADEVLVIGPGAAGKTALAKRIFGRLAWAFD